MKLNTWGIVPGMLAMASSPSHVLHTQPLRDNFLHVARALALGVRPVQDDGGVGGEEQGRDEHDGGQDEVEARAAPARRRRRGGRDGGRGWFGHGRSVDERAAADRPHREAGP